LKTYALSLKQPWAEFILSRRKVIETRSWDTKFRGTFLIHSSKNVDKLACKAYKLDPNSFITGCVVGKATLLSTKEYKSKIEFDRDHARHMASIFEFHRPMFGFILKDVTRIKPIQLKGNLGFFKVSIKWDLELGRN